tara:strand:+ start:49 stop:375 length:327 start_codon:yes stop_codon:yes gene_type:complete
MEKNHIKKLEDYKMDITPNYEALVKVYLDNYRRKDNNKSLWAEKKLIELGKYIDEQQKKNKVISAVITELKQRDEKWTQNTRENHNSTRYPITIQDVNYWKAQLEEVI